MNALVEAVKAHAIKNYEKGGWDFVVECHTDEEILKAIGSAKTEAGAIRNAAKNFAIALHDEQRRAVENEGF